MWQDHIMGLSRNYVSFGKSNMRQINKGINNNRCFSTDVGFFEELLRKKTLAVRKKAHRYLQIVHLTVITQFIFRNGPTHVASG